MEKNTIQTEIFCPEDLPEDIRLKLFSDPQRPLIQDGKVYVALDPEVVCIPDSPAGYNIACRILQKKNGFQSVPQNTGELYERMMNDPYFKPDPAMMKKYGIRMDAKRFAAVFRAFSPVEKDLYSILTSMAPVEAGDTLFPVDYQTAVFIKNAEGQSSEDIAEFIEAVIGTLETEGITDVHAGISREFPDISALKDSCAEALEALRLGIKYQPKQHVYAADRQTLDQIVDSIPDAQKRIILQTFFRQRPSGGLPEETIETVRVFFKNDLNLTAASKQLFIHRNTLNYRLDKIKKEFGLDLRLFEDAVVFRIISEIANQS